jgi:hypothetical protein
MNCAGGEEAVVTESDADGDIRVEVLPDPRYAGQLGPADLVERFADRAGELGAAIGAVAQRLRTGLEQQIGAASSDTWEVSEVSVEIALNLEAETGVVISKAKTGAAFNATLTWTRRAARDRE